MSEHAEILKDRLLGLQVCVPKDWNNEKISRFANNEYSSSIEYKWQVSEDIEKVQCCEHIDNVHVILNV